MSMVSLPAHPRAQRGFTLIEVMVVAAIVAILASIAYPSYRNAILKGRRAQARTAILELMQQEERYMTQNNTYFPPFSNNITTGVTTPATVPFKTFSGDSLSSAAYVLSTSTCLNPAGGANLDIKECVQVIATPRQADTAAGDIRMTSTGVKDCSVTPAPASSAICWP